MILYIAVYRPFKYAVSNFVGLIMEAFLLVVYLECVGLQDKNSDNRSSICIIPFFLPFFFIVWMLISTLFGFVLVADLAFVVFGWFKLSDYLYFRRFGIKKAFGIGTPRDRRIVVDSNKLKDMTLNGEGISKIDGRSMSYIDVSRIDEEDEN